MSIVSNIQSVVSKMSLASAIDFAIGEREFNNLLTAQREYQIWIDAPLQSNGTINAGSLRRNYQVKMLFVKKQNFGNNYQQHYDNAIDVMRTLSKEFILRLNNEVDNITGARVFDTVQSVRETDIINLFDQNLSGILIEFDLRLINDGSICTPNLLPAPTVYLFADFTTVVSGTTIRLGWIAFNVNTIEISGIGQVSAIGCGNVQIDVNATFTATAENESGTATDTITITVSNGCADATAVLKDTDGNVISTTNIPSGDSDDIVAPDATILINGDSSFPTIPSGGSENIMVENTNGGAVGAYDSNSNSWVIADSQVTVENSNQTFQTFVNVVAEGSAVEVLPDTTFQIVVNGNPIAPFDLPTLESNTININWTY